MEDDDSSLPASVSVVSCDKSLGGGTEDDVLVEVS